MDKKVNNSPSYCCGARHLPSSAALLGICRPQPLATLSRYCDRPIIEDLWRKCAKESNKKHHPNGWCFLLSFVSEKELGENLIFYILFVFVKYVF